MQSGLLHRSNNPPFLPSFLHNHPWTSTSSLRFPSLIYRREATPDSGRKRDGERRLKAKTRSRRWWSDDEPEELAPGLWEEFFDNMWFLKVLGSYGWISPIIMLSWLAASGPKAFLMSFSIPFGLSLLTYLFNKVTKLIQSNTDYKPTKATNTENVTMDEEDDEIQSDLFATGENGSVTGFGGWEDLIDKRELRKRRVQRSRRTTNEKSVPLQERMRELKTRVEGERDLPLLLKLLVAVFPFLSSWTELL